MGCFNHLVADKQRRQRLWEGYFCIRGELHKQPEPKFHTLQMKTPRASVRESTTTTMMQSWWFSCRCSVVTISARSWLLLYEQTSVTVLHRCLVVTNCMVLDGLWNFLLVCLIQIAIHNHYFFSLSATGVTTLWLKQLYCTSLWLLPLLCHK